MLSLLGLLLLAPCAVSSVKPVIVAARDDTAPHEQIVFLGKHVAMHYIPELGQYSLHQIVDNHPRHATKCPSLAIKPFASGRAPLNSVVSPFKERAVLFHDQATGNYSIWACEEFHLETGNATVSCSTIRRSKSADLVGISNVATFGDFTITLNNKGRIRLFNNPHDRTSTEGDFYADTFHEIPTSISLPELKSSSIFAFANHFIFEHSPTTGNYHIWVLDVKNTIVGPTASGSLPGFTTLAFMGGDRILASTADGDYLMLRFDSTQLVSDGELTFSTLGRGKFGATPCQYRNCTECTADSACGWCASSNRCLPGNVVEPCFQGHSETCESWMFGYCAVSSCASRLFRTDCIADKVCGWCEPTSVCVRSNALSCSNLTLSTP